MLNVWVHLVVHWSRYHIPHQTTFILRWAWKVEISSLQPIVTVLAIFNQLHVDPQLYAVIFGESMLNDAVAIVLYGCVTSYQTLICFQRTLDAFRNQIITWASVLKCILRFFSVFIGSLSFGVLIALGCSLLLKHTRLFEYPHLESCIVLLLAYMAYLLPNAIELSGMRAILNVHWLANRDRFFALLRHDHEALHVE